VDLLERYKNSVLQLLSPKDRPAVSRELQSLLDESAERRLEAEPDADPESIQVSVLADFGPPRDWAAQYLTKAHSLVGPALLPGFIRTVGIVVGAYWVLIVLAMFGTLDEASWRDLIRVLQAFGGDLVTGSLALFGTVTLIYAVVERQYRPVSGREEGEWDPRTLPDTPEFVTVRRTWFVLSLAYLALVFAYVNLFPGFLGGSFVSFEGTTRFVPLLGPAIRESMWGFCTCLAVDLVFTAAMMRVRAWRPWSRVVDSAISVAWLAAIAQPLFRGRLTVDEAWLLADGWAPEGAAWYAGFLENRLEGKMTVGLVILVAGVLVFLRRRIVRHIRDGRAVGMAMRQD
jgi:hypothetical protein